MARKDFSDEEVIEIFYLRSHACLSWEKISKQTGKTRTEVKNILTEDKWKRVNINKDTWDLLERKYGDLWREGLKKYR